MQTAPPLLLGKMSIFLVFHDIRRQIAQPALKSLVLTLHAIIMLSLCMHTPVICTFPLPSWHHSLWKHTTYIQRVSDPYLQGLSERKFIQMLQTLAQYNRKMVYLLLHHTHWTSSNDKQVFFFDFPPLQSKNYHSWHQQTDLHHTLTCDYLYGWIKKWSHTQKFHPNWTSEIQLGTQREEEHSHLFGMFKSLMAVMVWEMSCLVKYSFRRSGCKRLEKQCRSQAIILWIVQKTTTKNKENTTKQETDKKAETEQS